MNGFMRVAGDECGVGLGRVQLVYWRKTTFSSCPPAVLLRQPPQISRIAAQPLALPAAEAEAAFHYNGAWDFSGNT